MDHLQFISRDHCLLGRPDLIWPAFIGDLTFAIAYFAIPILIWYVTRKYHFNRQLQLVFAVYAAFIFLCGTTHLLDAILMWTATPLIVYLDVWVRLIGGLFSVFSAVVTLFAVRQFIALMGQFRSVVVEMKEDRKQHDRIQVATWERFLQVDARMKEYLSSKPEAT
jgi:hypothetical protein